MCRKFTVEHQEVGAESISIEVTVSNNPLRATRTNNRCSSVAGDRKYHINSLTQSIKKTKAR